MHLQDIIIIGGGKSISEGISLGLKEKLHGKCVFAVNYSYKYFFHTLLIFQDKNFYVPNYAKNYIDNNVARHPDIYEELKKEPLIIGINRNGIEEFKLENTILLNKKYYKNLTGILALDLACRLNPTNIWLLGFDWNRRTNLPERNPNYSPYTDEEIHFYSKKEINHPGQNRIGFFENHNPDKEFKEYLGKNINIYNVSLKSNITIFPKISYPEMFNKLGKYYLRQDKLRKEILKVFNQLF